MNRTKQRSAVWSMVNWSLIHQKIVKFTAVTPDQTSIEASIKSIESEKAEEDLFLMEAEALEDLLIKKLVQILQKDRGKEIKKNQATRERMRRAQQQRKKNFDVKVLPMGMGSMKDLKDMGLDPAAVEQISKKMMEQLFGAKRKKKKKGDDDEEDEEQPGSSFYM